MDAGCGRPGAVRITVEAEASGRGVGIPGDPVSLIVHDLLLLIYGRWVRDGRRKSDIEILSRQYCLAESW